MNSYINSVDFFKGKDPELIASDFGTPLYVYNEQILRTRMHAVSQVIKKYPYTANYSVKANTNIHILKLALEEKNNCDAMSLGEIKMLFAAGFPKEKIFFVPNNAGIDELEFAIKNRIMTSLDSLSQLELYGKICNSLQLEKSDKGRNVAVRINSGIGAGHCEKVITGGKKTKFGISSDSDNIKKIFEIADFYNLKIAGINQHIGSLFMESQPYLESVASLLHIALNFNSLEFIDFGGGYGIPYHKLDDEKDFPMESFKAQLIPILDEFVCKYQAKGNKIPLFKSEPGRYCVAEGGVILTRVHAIKENNGKIFCGTDCGMNVLVRPSMYDSWHDIEVLRNGKTVSRDCLIMQTVTGNICESGDILAKDRLLPKIQENDLLCILDSGAYGYSMCSSYNSRPRPAEVMIYTDSSVKLIRRRETIEDLMRYF
ncbi:MAG: diaminopimelate decarboxylase [Treponemataceae bacterium]